MIEYTTFNSSIGKIYIVALKEGVVKISFSAQSTQELKKYCRKNFRTKIREGLEYTQYAKKQILKYLEGNFQSLNFPVIHFNSPFRKKVLETERNIPYGETRSYGDVAKMVNNPRAYRAVGSANAQNPLPLYFPCHRIIASNGSLGEYGAGSGVKQYLLDLEAKNLFKI